MCVRPQASTDLHARHPRRSIVSRAPIPTLPPGPRALEVYMSRRLIALLLLGCLTANASRAFAAELGPTLGAGAPGAVAPEVLAAGSVEISRNGAENPMVEIARS